MRPYKKGKKDKNEKNEKKYIAAEAKISFAEFVSMTEEQHADLTATYGEADTKAMIEILNNHKGATGKVYRDDYYAIKNWCVDALKKQKEAPAVKSGKRNNFLNYTDEHTDFSDLEERAKARRQRRTPSA